MYLRPSIRATENLYKINDYVAAYLSLVTTFWISASNIVSEAPLMPRVSFITAMKFFISTSTHQLSASHIKLDSRAAQQTFIEDVDLVEAG
jgi:hypothetical protein